MIRLAPVALLLVALLVPKCSGTIWGNIMLLAIACGILWGTISLNKRTDSSDVEVIPGNEP